MQVRTGSDDEGDSLKFEAKKLCSVWVWL